MYNIFSSTTLPADIASLARQSEMEGYDFVRRLMDDWDSDKNRFDRAGELLIVAASPNSTIGICGLNVDPYSADQGVARLRHLYVSPDYRSEGVGSRLVEAHLKQLHQSFKLIRLRVPARAVGYFYEKLGFIPVDDHDATHELRIVSSD